MGARSVAFDEILVGAVSGRLGLGHLGACLRHLGFADGQLRLRRPLAVLCHVNRTMRIVQRGLRDQLLFEQCRGAFVGAARKLRVGAFGFHLVFQELGLCPFERGLRGKKIRLGASHLRQQLIFVEFDEHVAFGHDAVHVDAERLDDAVRLALDLDLGDRLDLAGRNDRADHRAALHGREFGGIDVRCGPGEAHVADRARGGKNRHGCNEKHTRAECTTCGHTSTLYEQRRREVHTMPRPPRHLDGNRTG